MASCYGVVIKRRLVTAILAIVAGANAGAQDWSELKTLTFTPESLTALPAEGSLAEAVAAAGIEPERAAGPARISDRSDGRAASPPEEPPAEQIIGRIRAGLAAIEAEEAANGENSPDLVPLLRNLAATYQEVGDYADAFAALERAQHLIRLQEGLYSFGQTGIIEEMIENEVAIAPGEESAGLESYLLELVQRNPDDPRVVEVLTGMAERQMDMARHLLIHGVPPELTINIQYVSGPSLRNFEPPRTARYMASRMLNRARFTYGTAMRSELRDDSPDIPLLLELEDSYIDTYYFELMNPDLSRVDRSLGRLRVGGLNALNAKLDNSRRYPGTPVAIANALTELADWQLLFGSFGAAMRQYEATRQSLVQQDVDERIIGRIFSPDVPVPLPAYTPNANAYIDEGDVYGHVDIAVEINRYGGVRDLRILGGSPNLTAAIERRAKRFVYQNRFRPRYVDGDWQRSDRLVVRYHFSYTSS